MSAALVIISEPQFDAIFDHLVSHRSGYRNMHMRATRKPKGVLQLKYLHAMYALKGSSKQIEGMFSGPKLFLHYKIVRRAGQNAQMVVSPGAYGDPRELDRLWKNFTAKVLRRVREERAARARAEQQGESFGPRYSPGQYYLRREHGGIPTTHQTCQRAIASGTLDQRFVSQLAQWDLRLICGQ